ncbi:MAG: HlyC/CorC family transporter [Actinobacteria bacterium]|nr:HlyC/CorC family transporter [Actinomycetota bacterium]
MIELFLILTTFVVTSLLAMSQSYLESEEDPRAGALSIARAFALISLSAMLLVLSPGSSILLALAVLLVWFSQQALGRLLGAHLGGRLVALLDKPITSFAKLVAPVRLAVPEIAEEYEQELIESVEEFSETVVREVMVPRVDMEVVQADQSLEDALSLFVSSGYSRLPVIGDGIDDVVGVLYLKDVARVTHQDPQLLETTTALQAARKPFFTPESKPVSELLQLMQQAKTQIAIVSDEYGGVAGIATVEDLIEELVGEIVDEYDREEAEIELVGEDLYRVSPRVTIDELAEHCEVEIDDEDIDTVAGLLIKTLGELPKGGEVVTAHGLELTAERVDAKRGRVMSVLVRKLADD